MKVLLIGNYVPDGQASMLAFTRVLERELPRAGCDLRVLAPPRVVLRVPRESRWWKWLGYVDKFILFIPRLALQARWADVVHICDHSNGMYVRWVRSKPTVITCHDVFAVQAAKGMVEGWHVGWPGRLFQRLIVRGLSKADLIACVSQPTRQDVLGLHLADERRVTTVPNGLNDSFAPVAPEEAHRSIGHFGLSANDKYLIHVGSALPRKNRKAVVETFVALHRRAARSGQPAPAQHLVFVGPALEPELAALLQRHGVADRVRALQDVSHEELRALYASATALLFPSLQEGFGWPLIEAQACGCPVIASDLPPMNEIGGDGACYVDPRDVEGMAQAIEQAVGRRERMRALGLKNAQLYSARQMTTNYMAAYRRAQAGRQQRNQRGIQTREGLR